MSGVSVNYRIGLAGAFAALAVVATSSALASGLDTDRLNTAQMAQIRAAYAMTDRGVSNTEALLPTRMATIKASYAVQDRELANWTEAFRPSRMAETRAVFSAVLGR